MTLAHDLTGEGPPLILIHGVTLDRRMWEPNLPALAASHRVVRVELRGFGATPPPDGPYSHEADLLALLAELGIDRAAIVGMSMGAAVALEFALAHPDAVAALVLVDADMPGVALDDELGPAITAAVKLARGGDVDAAREAWIATPFFAHSAPHTLPALREMIADYSLWHWQNPNPRVALAPSGSERLGDVRAPTLVLRGEHEVALFRDHFERLAREIPGARSAVLTGAGHMSNLDTPGAFDAAVLEFLAGTGS